MEGNGWDELIEAYKRGEGSFGGFVTGHITRSPEATNNVIIENIEKIRDMLVDIKNRISTMSEEITDLKYLMWDMRKKEI